MKMIRVGNRMFLIGLLSVMSVQAADKLIPAGKESIAKGKASYAANCVTCHGDQLDGNGVAGAAMNPKPRNLITEKFKAGDKPDQIFKTLTDGLKGTAMAGYGFLSPQERSDLTHYLVSVRKKK